MFYWQICPRLETLRTNRGQNMKSRLRLVHDLLMYVYVCVSEAGPLVCYCGRDVRGQSCSFQVFLRSGLAVSNNPGSPYPKKHLQGTPTSGTINTWIQLMDCALLTPFIYQTKASDCNYEVVSFPHKSVQLVKKKKEKKTIISKFMVWYKSSVKFRHAVNPVPILVNSQIVAVLFHLWFKLFPKMFIILYFIRLNCRLNTQITPAIYASEAPHNSSRRWQHFSKCLT